MTPGSSRLRRKSRSSSESSTAATKSPKSRASASASLAAEKKRLRVDAVCDGHALAAVPRGDALDVDLVDRLVDEAPLVGRRERLAGPFSAASRVSSTTSRRISSRSLRFSASSSRWFSSSLRFRSSPACSRAFELRLGLPTRLVEHALALGLGLFALLLGQSRSSRASARALSASSRASRMRSRRWSMRPWMRLKASAAGRRGPG